MTLVQLKKLNKLQSLNIERFSLLSHPSVHANLIMENGTLAEVSVSQAQNHSSGEERTISIQYTVAPRNTGH